MLPFWVNFQHAGARDDKGNPVIKDFFSSPLTARYLYIMDWIFCSFWVNFFFRSTFPSFPLSSGNTHDDSLLAKLEMVYTGSGDRGSSMVDKFHLFNVLFWLFCGF